MRKQYIDNIRWITVVIVVVYHVIYMFNGVTTFGVIGPFSSNQPQDAFLYLVYPWFMLLLFVVSGMAARFELEQTDAKTFLKKRTRKLLIPSTVGILVCGWILGYYNLLISGSYNQMAAIPQPVLYVILCLSGIGPLWYIQMLWIFSVIIVWIRRIEKDRIWKLCDKAGVIIAVLLTFAIYGSAQILNTPLVVVYRFGIYGAGFLIGYFLFSHDAVMERLEQKWLLLVLLAVASGVVFIIRYWGMPYPDHEVLDTFICNVFAWLGTLGVLVFMKKFGGFENAFSTWMKRQAWGLYIFHYLAIAASAWYLKLYEPELAPVCVYVLVGICGFGVPLLLNFVVSRIPILRLLLLGLGKERK